MAALQSIRKHGVLILIVVSIALILFIIPSGFFEFLQRSDMSTIAEIDGDKVDYEEYQNAINYHKSYLQVATGKNNFTEQELDNLKVYAWNDVLSKHLFKKNILLTGISLKEDKLGMSISEEEMEDLLYGSNIHNIILQQQMFTDPNTGMLDTATVKRFIAQAEQNDTIAFVVNYWKKMINNDVVNSKYNTLISKAFYTPTAIAKAEYEEANTKYTIEVLAKDYKSIPDENIKITDEEIKNYYDNNLYKFPSDKEVRKFDYVLFDVFPSSEDTLNAKKEIENYYDEYSTLKDGIVEYAVSKSEIPIDTNFVTKDKMPMGLPEEFFDAGIGTISEINLFKNQYVFSQVIGKESRPDSVQLSVIVLSTNDSVNLEQCKHQADSIKEIAKSGKQDFAVLAFTNSVDEQSKQKGGDWGWFTDGTNPLINSLKMNDELFTGNKGDIFIKDIVFNNGAQGVGLFKITNITEKSNKVKFVTIYKTINYSDETYHYAFSLANDFMSKSTSPAKFDSIVAKNSLIKREATVGELDNKFANLTGVREIVKWVYSVEDMKDSTKVISDVFPHESTFIIAKVTSITKKGTKSLEDVKNIITAELIRNKKAETLIAEMKTDLASNSDLLALSQKQYRYDTIKNVNFAQPYLQNYGQEQKVIGAMTVLPENKLSEIIQGDNAVYVFKVIGKELAPEKDNFDAEKIQSMQRAAGQTYRLNGVLEKMAEIKDNRARFD